MKKGFLLALIFLSAFLTNCETDRCDAGYTAFDSNGHEICLPDYIVGENQNLNLGNQFYHQEYGVITFENGDWVDKSGSVLDIKN